MSPRRIHRRSSTPAVERLLFAGLLGAFLYIMLLDGSIRLRTGQSDLTLLRDLIPLALLLFAATHFAVTRLPFPPVALRALVVLWVIVVLVQLANPDTISLFRGAQAARPHLEFVALFFVAALTMGTRKRLETFMLVLACGAAINGVVGTYQSGMSVEQLSGWGPGYERLLTNDNPRSFADDQGDVKLRPPALGGDAGFGGVLGLVALPGALAIAIGGRGRRRALAMSTIPFVIAGVLTSQTRGAVVAAVVAILVFLLFASLARGGLRVIGVATLIAVGALYVGNEYLSGRVTFDRYQSINPNNVTRTFTDERGGSLDLVDDTLAKYPLGAGMGAAGPGTRVNASVNAGKVNGENELNYLLVETGVPGLLVMLALFVMTIRNGRRLMKRETGELRLLVAGGTAAVVGLLTLWLGGPITAVTPSSPYFWAIAGSFGALALAAGKARVAARHSSPSSRSARGEVVRAPMNAPYAARGQAAS